MSLFINTILLSLSIILLFTLFIGTHATDITYPDHLVQSNHEQNFPESVRYMSKRRFLPTRRELHEYINDENEDDELHMNAKRYFLKSKRYFLNSKRDNE